MSKPVINIVGLSCGPEMDDKLNKWYNKVHIPMLMKNKKMKKVYRFRRLTNDENYPKYIAVYKFDNREDFDSYNTSQELVAAIEEAQETWKAGGPVEKARIQYELINSFEQ